MFPLSRLVHRMCTLLHVSGWLLCHMSIAMQTS
jgi:hypothetical protein